mgnify:CR=1 FL=1
MIKADDVSLRMLSNQMAQNRSSSQEKRVEKAIDTKGKKINDIIEAENVLANQKEQKDNSKLENLSLNDQVNFSTLTIEIYQHESLRQEMLASSKSAEYYKPHLGIRIIDALSSGWYVLLNIIVFMFEIWWLPLLGLIVYFVYNRFFKKQKE